MILQPNRNRRRKRRIKVKTRKKAFLIAISAILIVAATAFGTLAYLTSEIVVTHTFTVGDVEVSLTTNNSALMTFNGNEVSGGNAKKLLPNHEYYLPVIVDIGAGSEDAWVFVQVINPFEAVEAASGEKLVGDGEYRTVSEQLSANNWHQLTVDGKNVSGVYFFDDGGENGHVVSAGESLPVYDYFKVSSNAMGGTAEEAVAELKAEAAELGENTAINISDEEKLLYLGEYEDDNLMVIVYVVQADGLATKEAAWSVFEGQYDKNVELYLKEQE